MDGQIVRRCILFVLMFFVLSSGCKKNAEKTLVTGNLLNNQASGCYVMSSDVQPRKWCLILATNGTGMIASHVNNDNDYKLYVIWYVLNQGDIVIEEKSLGNSVKAEEQIKWMGNLYKIGGGRQAFMRLTELKRGIIDGQVSYEIEKIW